MIHYLALCISSSVVQPSELMTSFSFNCQRAIPFQIYSSQILPRIFYAYKGTILVKNKYGILYSLWFCFKIEFPCGNVVSKRSSFLEH